MHARNSSNDFPEFRVKRMWVERIGPRVWRTRNHRRVARSLQVVSAGGHGEEGKSLPDTGAALTGTQRLEEGLRVFLG